MRSTPKGLVRTPPGSMAEQLARSIADEKTQAAELQAAIAYWRNRAAEIAEGEQSDAALLPAEIAIGALAQIERLERAIADQPHAVMLAVEAWRARDQIEALQQSMIERPLLTGAALLRSRGRRPAAPGAITAWRRRAIEEWRDHPRASLESIAKSIAEDFRHPQWSTIRDEIRDLNPRKRTA